jgi:hypothetical protein
VYNSNVAVQSIVFHPEGGFDITYAEQEDVNPKVTILRQAMVAAGVVDITEVVDSIRELLDQALDAKLDAPTERIITRNRN